MKRPLLALLLSVSAIVLVSTHANANGIHSRAFKALGTGIVVPADWAGVWATTDSSYDCDGGFTGVSSSTDTVCGGERYSGDPTIDFSCTGTATSTTVNLTCTFSLDTLGCHFAYQSTIQGTRSGTTYHSVVISSLVVTGSGPFCGLVPGYCDRTVTNGNRTGPAPAAYCATPTTQTTWGRLKLIYR